MDLALLLEMYQDDVVALKCVLNSMTMSISDVESGTFSVTFNDFLKYAFVSKNAVPHIHKPE